MTRGPNHSVRSLAPGRRRTCSSKRGSRGDHNFLDQAEAEIREGLRLSPEDFRLQLLEAKLVWLRGDLDRALPLALALNQRMPDELETYSLLVRIHLQSGDTKAAIAAAQWMLNLRDENPLSLWRAADIREATGDAEGALRLLEEAFPRLSPSRRWDRTLMLA